MGKPPLKRLKVVFRSPKGQEKVIGRTSSGWLITVSETLKITLSNKVAGVRVQLPQISLPSNQEGCSLGSSKAQNHRVHKAVVSSTPDDDCPDDFVVMIIYGESKQLAYYKSKDKIWALLIEAGSSYDDILSHEGQLYAVDEYGKVVYCRVDSSPAVTVITERWFFWGQKVNLVVIGDQLFLIIRYVEDLPCSGRLTSSFLAGQLTGSANKGRLVADLADWTVLLGYYHSVALPPRSLRGMDANCIYFKDDCINVQRDNLLPDSGFRVFSMEDRRIEQLLCPPDGLHCVWQQEIVS